MAVTALSQKAECYKKFALLSDQIGKIQKQKIRHILQQADREILLCEFPTRWRSQEKGQSWRKKLDWQHWFDGLFL